MNQSRRYFFERAICRYLLSLFLVLSASFNSWSTTPDFDFSDEEVEIMLAQMESIVEAKYTPQVRGHIVTYLKLNREKTERLLARSMIYFPIIEKYLHEHNLPEDLKYLAIIESALEPRARSRMGAVGLWQFMPYTGKEKGLRIYSSVDERKDPHRASLAAMQYLTQLYNRFGDWALAMAAYNSGPGRVETAIRKSGSRDFWVLYRYLPRETRGYIPAFIAAAYVFKHSDYYNFEPQQVDPDWVFTERVTLYQKMTFNQIAARTGLDLQTIKKLNPSYRYNYVPASSRGYGITLPKRVIKSFKTGIKSEVVQNPDSDQSSEAAMESNEMEDGKMTMIFTSYVPDAGENIHDLASLLEIDAFQLKVWNSLREHHLDGKKELKIPLLIVDGEPVIRHFVRKPAVEQVQILSVVPIEFKSESKASPTNRELYINKSLPAKWTLRRGESMSDLLKRNNVSTEVRNQILLSAKEKLEELNYGQFFSQ